MHERHRALRLDAEADGAAVAGSFEMHGASGCGSQSRRAEIMPRPKAQASGPRRRLRHRRRARRLRTLARWRRSRSSAAATWRARSSAASSPAAAPPTRSSSSIRARRSAQAWRAASASASLAAADASLAAAALVVWAVKPQLFRAAAAPCAPYVGGALQLSVMAGIRSDAIAEATGSERVVRAMPNTPALIGQGIAGVYARPAVSARRPGAGRRRRSRRPERSSGSPTRLRSTPSPRSPARARPTSST